MGTRGTYGLRKNETDKLMYNHFDSYPSELGVSVMAHVKSHTDEELSKQFDFMEQIDENVPPTKEQIAKCLDKKTVDLNVSKQKVEDWYCLLRNSQGNLSVQCPPNGIPYFVNSNNFVKDSLFCEWGYIINVDTGKLEIYKGFNKSPGGKGRYADLKDDNEEYYGIVLIGEIPFEMIREWSKKQIEKAAMGFEAGSGDDE